MNKASGGDGIPAELFQILKGNAVKKLSSGNRTGKGQFTFQFQRRIFKLPYNCPHFTWSQGNAQNPSSQASTVHALRTSRCTSWIQKRQRNQRSSCQHPLDHRKSMGIPKSSASLTTVKPLCGSQQTGKFLKTRNYQTTLLAS